MMFGDSRMRRHGIGIAVALAGLVGSSAIVMGEDAAVRFNAVKSPAGLSFYHRYDVVTPFAAINFGMRDIYALTTRGKEGLASLGGALVMQGADGAGQTEFIEQLKDLAAGASVSFGTFATQGSVRAPAATLAPATALVAAALKTAEPTDKVLARLKHRAIGGEAQAVARAETIAQRAAVRLVLGDHPITRASDPTRFERISREDLGEWRKRVLDRAKLRIVVSGRVAEGEAARIVDAAFADLPARLEPIAYQWPAVEVPRAIVVIEHETPQSAIVMMGLTSIATGREAETAIIANAVLGGGGGNSRLWNAVRAGLGATYGAGSGFQLVGPNRRLFRMSAAVANDQIKAVIEALTTAYSTWRTAGVTAAEHRAATTRTITDFKSAFDDPSRANGLVLSMALANRPVDELASYEPRLTGLTTADLNTFIASKFPAPDQLLIVVVTPHAEGLGADCTVRALEQIERCAIRRSAVPRD